MAERAAKSVYMALIGIILVTVVAYLPVFDSQKEFTNWDDNLYVTELPLVKSLDADSVAKMFDVSTTVASNYHPLTMLSLAVNYAVSGESARGFAVVNLILHVVNALLVFVLVRRLTKGIDSIAMLTALWFAIHPMHVESVAWVSERKDVLYTLFLLVSMLSYVRYIETRSVVWIAGTFIAFVASCLSKAMAVPLPIALFLFDYWYDRPIKLKSVLEKVPFVAISLWIGLLTIQIQSVDAIAKYEVLTISQRFAFAGYGFVMYWVKMLVPYNLSTFYPYPTTNVSGSVSWWYYTMPLVAVAIMTLPYVVVRKNPSARKYVVLGIGLYTLFVALVLQFVSVGMVIMAERYTYVPYIGALLLLAYGAYVLHQRSPGLARIVVAVYTIALIPITYTQVATWTNSDTLWTRVIELYPYEFIQSGSVVTVTKVGTPVAYLARADYYYVKNRLDDAFADLRVVEIVNAKGWKSWQALGVIYGMKGQYVKSQECLTRALKEEPGQPSVLYNRAISYVFGGMPAKAVEDFSAALEYGITGKDRYQSLSGKARESLKLGDALTCARVSEQTIAEFPKEYDGYFLRGTALINLKRPSEAIPLLEQAVSINAADATGWFNLSLAYRAIGDIAKFRDAARKAKDGGFQVPDAYLN